MVNEPSVFEPLKFCCKFQDDFRSVATYTNLRGYPVICHIIFVSALQFLICICMYNTFIVSLEMYSILDRFHIVSPFVVIGADRLMSDDFR